MNAYELSILAESDLEEILEYTFESFGQNQMYKYMEQLEHCLNQLVSSRGSYRRLDVGGKSVRSLRCKKHYIFAVERQDLPLLIIAVLHERMDLVKRIQNRL